MPKIIIRSFIYSFAIHIVLLGCGYGYFKIVEYKEVREFEKEGMVVLSYGHSFGYVGIFDNNLILASLFWVSLSIVVITIVFSGLLYSLNIIKGKKKI
ncbi:hypothetical protein [Bacillus sp. FJAT-22090]|uniref:hypothetical protein n=1 Tax=Bacillus sp. FJAT-22090 TaxID=1581038 RepID=UPI0011A5CE02|nr:hypothetical protein [Bacillus sp. FJAT-22090]